MINYQTKQNEGGVNDSRTSNRAGALEQNSRNDELKTAVSSTGQTLTANTVQVDNNTTQLAKAMFINGSGASSMQDNGSVNSVQLTPVTGSSGLRVPTAADGGYNLMNGVNVIFTPSAINTGNTTLNVGQTTGTLLGSKKLLNSDSTELAAGSITTNIYYTCRYDNSADSGAGAWLLLTQGIEFATSQETIDGILTTKATTPSGVAAVNATQRFGGALLQNASPGSTNFLTGVTNLNQYTTGGYWAYAGTYGNTPSSNSGFVRVLFDGNNMRIAQFAVETGGIQPVEHKRLSLDGGATWTGWSLNVDSLLTALTTRRGIVELSTNAEAIAGTDATKAITPANLAAAIDNRLSLTLRATRTADGTFSVTGLSLGHPLFVITDGGTGGTDNSVVSSVSGVSNPINGALIGGDQSSNTVMMRPSSTTVSLNITGIENASITVWQ